MELLDVEETLSKCSRDVAGYDCVETEDEAPFNEGAATSPETVSLIVEKMLSHQQIDETNNITQPSTSVLCTSTNKNIQNISETVSVNNKVAVDLLTHKDMVRPSDYVVVLKQIQERKNAKLSEDGNEYIVIEDQLRQQEAYMKKIEKSVKDKDNRFPCSKCEMDFKNMGTLTRHLRNHSGFKPYQCASCNKGFTTKYSVVVHFRKHSGETPYECEVCERKFNQLGSLSLHKRTHSGETPYECQKCGKKFKQQTNLQVHLTAHTGDKLFVCEICSRSFAYKSILTKHMRIHTGEKPYSCLVCHQKFRNRSNLNRHINLHTDTRPHVCTKCGKKYIQLCDLAKHYESHSDTKNYPCRLCERKYALMATLRRHMQTKHSDVDFSGLTENAHILRKTFENFVDTNAKELESEPKIIDAPKKQPEYIKSKKRGRKQITPRKKIDSLEVLDDSEVFSNVISDTKQISKKIDMKIRKKRLKINNDDEKQINVIQRSRRSVVEPEKLMLQWKCKPRHNDISKDEKKKSKSKKDIKPETNIKIEKDEADDNFKSEQSKILDLVQLHTYLDLKDEES